MSQKEKPIKIFREMAQRPPIIGKLGIFLLQTKKTNAYSLPKEWLGLDGQLILQFYFSCLLSL
jgi:hypothetical protein